MPELQCPHEGCESLTTNPDKDLCIALFNAHISTHSKAGGGEQRSRAEKLVRPRIAVGMLEENWSSFLLQWDMYATGSALEGADRVRQLLYCCESQLMDMVLGVDPQIATRDEDRAKEIIKRMAVVPVAMGVRRAEMLAMKQEAGEPSRAYAAKIQRKAATCQFQVTCPIPCGKNIDFTEILVKYTYVNGLEDDDIKKEALGWDNLDTSSLAECIAHVEKREMARDALKKESGLQAAGISAKEKGAKDDPRLRKKIKCANCTEIIAQFAVNRNGSIGERKLCPECWRQSRKSHPMNTRGERKPAAPSRQHAVENTEAVAGSQQSTHNAIVIATVRANSGQTVVSMVAANKAGGKAFVLDHHVYSDSAGWMKKKSDPAPNLMVQVSVNREDYLDLGLPIPMERETTAGANCDSGADSTLWGLKHFHACGFKKGDLYPVVSQKLSSANGSHIDIVGAIVIRISGWGNDGIKREAREVAYVTSQSESFYVSRTALKSLGIIPKCFPRIGSCETKVPTIRTVKRTPRWSSVAVAGVGGDTGQEQSDTGGCGAECHCPKREKPPPCPASLPFEPCEENIPKMEQWLKERFAASTFNKCSNQELPFIAAEPMKIHVDDDAVPVAKHKPTYVPLHWKERVKADLEKDVRLGIIERVPDGEPVEWLHRMVITSKADGSPRRTVDLSPLNKHCKRETFGATPPFQLARQIPAGVWKTVTDAWEGFHSCLIAEEDRNLTAFNTEWGRFRYRSMPQGYISSSDNYNKRFNDVIEEVPRRVRCVDDTAMWDLEMEEHWWRALRFLELVGSHGYVLNPNQEKFQFCRKEVRFAGYQVSENKVEPLKKFLDAIEEFPAPRNKSDLRSFYGLVNQVSHYNQLRALVAPFRPLLSTKTKFYWNDELQTIFERAKLEIVSAIKEGVEIYSMERRTALRTDYSNVGIGYFLYQKHCECQARLPGCCEDGWRVVLAGSRFLKPAETRYAPIEGEALAVAWALEQTKYFTLGNQDLVVVVDHKPAVGIFETKTLDEIPNHRLFSFKQASLPWRFEMAYIPGKENQASDAVSRYPAEGGCLGIMATIRREDTAGELQGVEARVCSISRSILGEVTAVTWNRVKETTKVDHQLQALISQISKGFPEKLEDMDPELSEYWRVKGELSVVDGVVLAGCRIVIPTVHRAAVLESLGAAHQGESAMHGRARSSVYWPGITADITASKKSCTTCWENAPSLQKNPPQEPRIPSVPFEMIVADYFKLAGYYYLVVGDRLSGWTETTQVHHGSVESGTKGLIAALRRVFAHFGVPRDLSSDGGPEFQGHELSAFLKRWGVSHTLSSAWLPSSNGRAELAVKQTKRMLRDNAMADGSVNTDKYVRALLTLRNAPDFRSGLSPAEILMGHKLSDTLPTLPKEIILMENPRVHPTWRDAWQKKEDALRARYLEGLEKAQVGTKPKSTLVPGETVLMQNQTGINPTKWGNTGTIMEACGHDQYIVKVHGSGRLSRRNRQFLRKYEMKPHFSQSPLQPEVTSAPAVPQESPQPQPDTEVSQGLDREVQQGPQESQVPPMRLQRQWVSVGKDKREEWQVPRWEVKQN